MSPMSEGAPMSEGGDLSLREEHLSFNNNRTCKGEYTSTNKIPKNKGIKTLKIHHDKQVEIT